MQSDGWIWSNVCPEVIPAKALTMLSGVFFVLLGLFWLLVLWWSRPTRTPLPSHFRNFSVIALLWWTLCLYFMGVATALATEVYEQSDLIATLGNATSKNDYYRSMSVECEGGDTLEVPNNMVPLWALGSMAFLWLLYICIFIAATVSIYTV